MDRAHEALVGSEPARGLDEPLDVLVGEAAQEDALEPALARELAERPRKRVAAREPDVAIRADEQNGRVGKLGRDLSA